jgi:hypothetical protein
MNDYVIFYHLIKSIHKLLYIIILFSSFLKQEQFGQIVTKKNYSIALKIWDNVYI